MTASHTLAESAQRRPAQSLQARLTGTVLAMVFLVWTVVAVATWHDTEHEVGELLDAHLSQAASLLVSQPLDDLTRINLQETPTLHEYQPKVVLQVWHEETLVVRSSTAPLQPLTASTQRGFSQTTIDGVAWRVFSAQGHDEHVVVHVAEQDQARQDVVLASMRSVIWPVAVALPFLGFGVWAAIRQALKPLSALGYQVAHRKPDASEPLPDAGVPREVLPLVDALNRLFGRIAMLIDSERRFTADAAHELRTPLAGIRMQAQVAQGADDAGERNDALAATLQGCDRAARLVDQLLQLARLESQADVTGHRAHVPTWVRTIAADLTPVANRRGQHIRTGCDPTSDKVGVAEPVALDAKAETDGQNGHGGTAWCPVPEGLLGILLRNLLDNALRYSPNGAVVQVGCGVLPQGGGYLSVEDSGPGMSADDIRRLGERFFRVVGTNQPGSGLGWSIVTRIARLYDLTLTATRSPELGGLRVTVSWAPV